MEKDMWHKNAEMVRQMRTMELEEIVMTIYGAAQWLYEERFIVDDEKTEEKILSFLCYGHVGQPDGLVAQLDDAIDAVSPTSEQSQLLQFTLWFIQRVNGENGTDGPWFNGVSFAGDEEGSMGLKLAVAFIRAFRHQLRELSPDTVASL